MPEEQYNLEDALVIAGFLNVFIRNADLVTEKKADVAASGTQFTYSFPEHSFTMLKGRIVRC